jgi:hypothetical protein
MELCHIFARASSFRLACMSVRLIFDAKWSFRAGGGRPHPFFATVMIILATVVVAG